MLHWVSDPQIEFKASIGFKVESFQVCIFGTFRVEGRDGVACEISQRKARCLIAYLSCVPNHEVSREKIAALLWSGKKESAASDSLRRVLSDITKTDLRCLFRKSSGNIALNTDAVGSDLQSVLGLTTSSSLEQFERIYMNIAEPLQSLDHVDPAFDDWLRSERSFIQSRAETVLLKIIETDEPKSEAKQALAAKALLRLDDTNEPAAEFLMRVLSKAGRSAAAKQVFNKLRDATLHGLGIEPSESSVRCYISSSLRENDTRPLQDVEANVNGFDQLRQDVNKNLAIAILQPENRTGDPNIDILMDGLGEELARSFYRFRWLKTRCYASFRSFKDIHHPSSALINSKYILKSALSRRAGGYFLQVSVLDSTEMSLIWSDRIEAILGKNGDGFDALTSQIASIVDARLFSTELSQARLIETGNLDSVTSVFRAIPHIYEVKANNFSQASTHLDRALELNPFNSQAHAWKAYWHTLCVGQNWLGSREQHLMGAKKHADIAIQIDPDDSQSLAIRAHIHAFLDQRFDEATEIFDRAIALNPNSGFSLAYSSATLSYLGHTNEALQRLSAYKDTTPFHPHGGFLDGLLCVAHSFAGNFEETVLWGKRLLRTHPQFVNGYKHVISSLGHLNRKSEAKEYLLLLEGLEPGFCASDFVRTYPMSDVLQKDRIVDGLRRAGVRP